MSSGRSDAFVPGLALNRAFFRVVVRPLLANRWPQLRYAAALVGSGSEVLGFDTPRSADHSWGLRFQLFLAERDLPRCQRTVRDLLARRLPRSFAGHSTHWAPAAGEDGIRVPRAIAIGPVDHGVEITSVKRFFTAHFGFDPTRRLASVDWLLMPQQRLLTTVRGEVYHDGLGELSALRRRLIWYPDPVWRYLLAAQWARIGQEEPFPGRCAEVGDDLGSRIVTARLARDLIRLAFLQARQYAPYPKWLGTAFAQLPGTGRLRGVLSRMLTARRWAERQRWLARSLELSAVAQNRLRLVPPLPARVSSFHGRPFLVIHADRFALALGKSIRDPATRALPPRLGSVDQFSDSTDLNDFPERTRRLSSLYSRRAR